MAAYAVGIVNAAALLYIIIKLLLAGLHRFGMVSQGDILASNANTGLLMICEPIVLRRV